MNWIRVAWAAALLASVAVIFYEVFQEKVNIALFFVAVCVFIISAVYVWDFLADDEIDGKF